MKYSIRKLEAKIARNITPQGSVALSMIAMLFVMIAILAVTSCATSPDEIRDRGAEINAKIDAAQAEATTAIVEQAEIAEATKEVAKEIRDNVKESVDDVADVVKESIKAVTEDE